jgi:hypothetical protein
LTNIVNFSPRFGISGVNEITCGTKTSSTEEHQVTTEKGFTTRGVCGIWIAFTAQKATSAINFSMGRNLMHFL